MDTLTRLLTRRQAQALLLLMEDLTILEIAQRMHLAQRTAKNHLTEIYTALDVRSCKGAAVWGARNEALVRAWAEQLPFEGD